MKRTIFVALLLLSGCAKDISPRTYSVGSVGQVNRSIAGVVVSAREVSIAGTTNLGSGSGALAGGVAGSTLGGNNARGNIVGAIGGAVVGGIAGAAIEAGATKQTGVEYVVETENGNLMTIVQGSQERFVEGQGVLVLYGSPSRLVADPRKR